MVVNSPPVPVKQPASEKLVAFPLAGNSYDPEKARRQCRLVPGPIPCFCTSLYAAIDEHKASDVQGALQLHLDEQTAEKIAGTARGLGLNVTAKDQ